MSSDSEESERAIPQEQYDHISAAMRDLSEIDLREVPDDVGEYLEDVYWTLDGLYGRVDDDDR